MLLATNRVRRDNVLEQKVLRRVLYPEQGDVDASETRNQSEYEMRQDGGFHRPGHCGSWYQCATRPAVLSTASHAVPFVHYVCCLSLTAKYF